MQGNCSLNIGYKKMVFTSFVVFLGINNRKRQASNKRTELTKPWQCDDPVEDVIGTELN